MVRLIFLSAFFISILSADMIKSAASLSTDPQRARELFMKFKNLKQNDGLDIKNMVEILTQNNLFDLNSFGTERLNLTFSTDDEISSTLFIKAINLSLNSLGAQVLSVNEFSNLTPITYSLSAVKSDGIDIVAFNNALNLNGIKILDISRENKGFKIILNAKGAQINSVIANFDSELSLSRSNSPYLINLNGANSVEINIDEQSHWIPLVRIYDKNLEQILLIQETSSKDRYSLIFDKDAAYILLDDSVDMGNIKGDIVLKFEKYTKEI